MVCTSGSAHKRLGRAGAESLRLGPGRQRRQVGHHQHDGKPAPVAQHDGVAHELAALDHALDRLRRDVLAAGGDDQILLSVGDLEETVRVEQAHVTGMEPAFAVQRLRGGLRLPVVARHDVGTPGDDLAIRSDPHLHPRNRPAHRAQPEVLEGVDRDDR